MSSVVPEEKFRKKLMQKEFDTLYLRYINRDTCVTLYDSLVRICAIHKVKIIEFFCGSSGYSDNVVITSERFLEVMEGMEWDYEFVKDDILRIGITSSFWFDIYFPVDLSQDIQDEYLEWMEHDVLNNYARMDDYTIGTKLLFDQLADMQERFFADYGEDLVPSFFTA